jgi:hypothetical protein
MIPRTIMISLFLFLHSNITVAAPISYDELIDGELNDQLLILGVGTNTISGDWTLIWPSTIDYDPFFFEVATDSIVTAISLTFDSSGVVLTDGHQMIAGYRILDSSPALVSRLDFILPLPSDSPQHIPASDLPLTAGTYHLIQTGSFLVIGSPDESLAQGDGGTVPYSWEFEIESSISPLPAVPVPAAFWLFGTALVGFIGISRRRKVA